MPFTILAPIIYVLCVVGGYAPTKALHDVEVRQRNGTRQRMTTEGEAMRVHCLGVDQWSANGLGEDHASARRVARGDALGERADIGVEAQPIRGEPAPHTTEAGNHLVAPEQ